MEWQLFDLGDTATLADYLEIIEDGLVYAFEFKIEDGHLYFRETTP